MLGRVEPHELYSSQFAGKYARAKKKKKKKKVD